MERGVGCEIDDCFVIDMEDVKEFVVLFHCGGWAWKVLELKVLGRKWF